MAHFYIKPFEENTWNPEVLGINYSERVAKLIGDLAVDSEVWTAWADIQDDEGDLTIQCTPDNTQIHLNNVEPDADRVCLLDPRDGLYFTYYRYNYPEIFDTIAGWLLPWAVTISSITPIERALEGFLKQQTGDVENFEIPDDWEAEM